MQNLIESSTGDIEEINLSIKTKTGIHNFFNDENQLNHILSHITDKTVFEIAEKDLGDFQTPPEFVQQIVDYIQDIQLLPTILVEPTGGIGNFVFPCLNFLPSIQFVYFIETQKQYIDYFKLKLLNYLLLKKQMMNLEIEIYEDDVFIHQFSKKLFHFLKNHPSDRILILGNPPWLTNTGLSKLNSSNLPKKSNYLQIRGIEAITGKSNFDIAEYIILDLINSFSNYKLDLVFICKRIVIRRILKNVYILPFQISKFRQLNFSAKKIFNVAASASVFHIAIGNQKEYVCSVYRFAGLQFEYQFGWVENQFVSDLSKYQSTKHIEGFCKFNWRQGIKHDLSKIMVLEKISPGHYRNGLNNEIELEDEFIFPILRASNIANNRILDNKEYVIVTQQTPNQDTIILEKNSPKLWKYLNNHKEKFGNRKSKIYHKSYSFGIFGIGPYAFAPYKIAIASMYKKPNFTFIDGSNQPIMVDDTTYFLSFDDKTLALHIWLLLNTDEVRKFLQSIVFLDSKRPFTKEILMRINIDYLRDSISQDQLVLIANKLVHEGKIDSAAISLLFS